MNSIWEYNSAKDIMMEKISVIVPCYNVERYIDRCLESIVNQTVGKDYLEIICVNDGSTDGTLDKLKEWEEKYPDNIMIITYEENIKQGGARNIGLNYASSKYIGFVDADDWIEPEMYEVLYSKMTETGCDLVKCKYIRNPGDGSIKINTNKREDYEYRFKKVNGFYKYAAEKTGNNGTDGGITCGLFLKDIIVGNQVYFPERLAYEDNYWLSLLNMYISSVYIVDLVLYHYYINPSSTVTTRNSPVHFDRLIIEPMLIDEYIKRGAFDIFKDDIFSSFIQRYYLNSLFMLFTRFDRLPGSFDIKQMIDTLYKYFPEYIDVMKGLPVDISTKDPNSYLLNILLVEDLHKNKTIDEIQREFLRLL